jgi:hypothetical protein
MCMFIIDLISLILLFVVTNHTIDYLLEVRIFVNGFYLSIPHCSTQGCNMTYIIVRNSNLTYNY